MQFTYAATSLPRLSLQSSAQDGFMRLSLNTPSGPVSFTHQLSGNKLYLHFDTPYQFDFSKLGKNGNNAIISAAEGADGKSISLTLDNPSWRVRSFKGSQSSGVDLKPKSLTRETPDQKPKEELVVIEQPKKELSPEKKPISEPIDLLQHQPPKTEEAPKASTTPSKPKPQPKKEEKKQAQLVSSTQEEKPAKHAQPSPQGDDVIPPSTHAETNNVPSSPTERDSLDVPPVDLILPSTSRTAIFKRNKQLWVFFDRPVNLPLATLTAHHPILGQGKSYPAPNYSAFSFPLKQDADVSALPKGHLGWRLTFSEPSSIRPIGIVFGTKTLQKQPYTTVLFDGSQKPIQFTDPLLGTALMIYPTNGKASWIHQGINRVDYRLLATSQGVVIEQLADSVKIQRTKDGLSIFSIFPNTTSPPETSQHDDQQSPPESSTIFDNSILFSTPPHPPLDKHLFSEEFSKLRHAAFQGQIASRTAALKQLTTFFFANKLYAETHSMIRLAHEYNPVTLKDSTLRAMQFIALFKTHRYSEAALALDAIESEFALSPSQKDEMSFMRQAINLATQPSLMLPSSFTFLENTETFLPNYEPSFQKDLALLALTDALNQHDSFAAKEIFAYVRKHLPNQLTKHEQLFFEAKIAATEGKFDVAIPKWDTIIADPTDRRLKAMALLDKTMFLRQQQKITSDEAIQNLEKATLIWRGDHIEIEALDQLATIHIQERQYREGLVAWKTLITYYPSSPDTLDIAKKMAQTFNYMFNQHGLEDMSPLKALALYYEFRELTPIGPLGDQLVMNLVNYLYQADLLDQAATLLAHQTRYRLKGAQRVVASEQLALLYLLNKKPTEALDVLYGIPTNALTKLTKLRYKYFISQALLDQGKYDAALRNLGDDESHDSDALLSDIYFKKSDWEGLISIEHRLLSRMNEKAEKPLTPIESHQLLRLAIAHTMLHHQEALSTLYDSYNDRIAKVSFYPKAFQLLTSPSTPDDLQATLKSMQDVQTFLQQYKDAKSLAL